MQPSSPRSCSWPPVNIRCQRFPGACTALPNAHHSLAQGQLARKGVQLHAFRHFGKAHLQAGSNKTFLLEVAAKVLLRHAASRQDALHAIRQEWIQNPGLHAQARALQSRLCATSGLPKLAALKCKSSELQKQRIIPGFDHFEMSPSRNTSVSMDAQVNVNREKSGSSASTKTTTLPACLSQRGAVRTSNKLCRKSLPVCIACV